MNNFLRAYKLVLEASKAIATLAPDAAAMQAEVLMHREPLAKPRAKPAIRRVNTKMARLICEFVGRFPELSEFKSPAAST
jgi:hypothetical protein